MMSFLWLNHILSIDTLNNTTVLSIIATLIRLLETKHILCFIIHTDNSMFP